MHSNHLFAMWPDIEATSTMEPGVLFSTNMREACLAVRKDLVTDIHDHSEIIHGIVLDRDFLLYVCGVDGAAEWCALCSSLFGDLLQRMLDFVSIGDVATHVGGREQRSGSVGALASVSCDSGTESAGLKAPTIDKAMAQKCWRGRYEWQTDVKGTDTVLRTSSEKKT